MKGNNMIRAAFLVLVLILVSSCCIGGTFARYTTGALGSDSARVAKWGIARDFGVGGMFETVYDQTVSSENGDQLVAPGTKDGFTFALTGAPEVSYRVLFALKEPISDVALLPGDYTFAGSYQNMTVSVAEKYLPLKWVVTFATEKGDFLDTGNKFAFDEATQTYKAEFASLTQIQTALETVSVTYATNEACDVRVNLSWEWEFNEGVHTDKDRMDTVLGYYIAKDQGKLDALPFTASENAGAVNKVSYTFQMTAVQID